MLRKKSYCIPAVWGCLVAPHTALPGAAITPMHPIWGAWHPCRPRSRQAHIYIFCEFDVLKVTVTLIVNAFFVTLIIAIDFLPVGANKYIPEHECTSWDHFVGFLSFTSVSNLLIC